MNQQQILTEEYVGSGGKIVKEAAAAGQRTDGDCGGISKSIKCITTEKQGDAELQADAATFPSPHKRTSSCSGSVSGSRTAQITQAAPRLMYSFRIVEPGCARQGEWVRNINCNVCSTFHVDLLLIVLLGRPSGLVGKLHIC